MSPREVSIAFQTDKTSSEYRQLARLVNKYDFDVVSVYCDAPYHPSFGPLFLMAPYLEKARLGPAAISPFRIHPIDIAANAALLADLAGGMVYIGLARGAWLAEHGIEEPDKPIGGMREAIEIIRGLLSGEYIGRKSEVFNIPENIIAPYPVPEKKLPLMIGTWGKKLAQLAGELADEVKIGGSANPAMAEYLRSYVDTGASRAGRSGSEIGIVLGAVTVVDEDRDLAKKLARKQVAMYLPVVMRLDPTITIDSELVDRIRSGVLQGDLSLASKLVSDEVLDLFVFSGNPEDIADQANRAYDNGVTRIEFGTPHGIDPAKGIKLLGSKVLPRLSL
jgi:5,10-methylenetetrahydromethanopterin reductase